MNNDTATPAKPWRFPVFVVGSARSGTSVLLSALRAAGYAGYAEGNFLSLINVIERDVDRHFATFERGVPQILMAHLDRDALKRALARVLVAAAEEQQTGSPWVDKTGGPDMIRSIPMLRQILPTSCFIFAKRRAIENVVSRVRKFPAHGFEFHCAAWAQNMAAWRRLRQTHPDIPAIEIDQQDISARPADMAARIAAFLALDAPAQRKIAEVFTGNRPQQTEAGSADRVLNLADIGWPAEDLAAFHRLCDDEMRISGYSMDSTYRLTSADA